MYDLIIKNGIIVDPENKIHGKFDIAVLEGKVALVSENIDFTKGRQVLNMEGKTIIPGIIDMHVHTGFSRNGEAAMTMLAKAGTVTAMDCGGPLEEFYYLSKNHGSGMNLICLQMIKPGFNVESTDPSEEEISELIVKSLQEGALGMKLLGGHYPMTVEATRRVIEIANQKKAFIAFHVGTSRNGAGNYNSLKDAIELSKGLSIDIVHMNANCRGQILDDPIAETLGAFKMLEDNPNVFSESYLSIFSGSPGKCSNGELESNGPKNSLGMGGYEKNERGLRKAISEGWASVVCQSIDGNIRITGEEGIAYWESQGTDAQCTFPVTPASTRFLMATEKNKSGKFFIDAISTDGGATPRNFIVEKGTALIRMDMLTWEDFVIKTSTNPARIFGLENKGHLGLGADADMTILEGTSGKAYSTINGGRIIMIDGVVLGKGATVLTTEYGVKAVESHGLKAEVVDLTTGWFYGGRPKS